MTTIKPIKTPEPLYSLLKQMEIKNQTYQHAPCFTVDEGLEIKAQLDGGHTKNLFLKDKKGVLWLVIALENSIIDLKWLPKRINSARLSFGKPELLEKILKVAPGHVTPFALIHDHNKQVNVILDKKMMACEKLNYHPLKNDKTTTINASDLLKFLKNLEYQPLVIDFQ